jgi:hypothetical protein
MPIGSRPEARAISGTRVLYVIQTFDERPQIQRLISTILASDPVAYVVICHNCDRFRISDADIGEPQRVSVLNQPGGSRVDFYQVDTYLQALALMQRKGIEYDWVMNLTGQCYPVRPLADFGETLTRRGADAYLLCHKVFAAQGGLWPLKEAQARYLYRYRWRLTRDELPKPAHRVTSVVREAINRAQPWVRLDTSYALQIGLRHKGQFLPEGWDLFGGFYFMSIARKAATRLLEFADSHPQAMKHFRLMNIPSEVFAQTVLANQPDLRLSQTVPLYVEYGESRRGRPRVLSSADVEAIREQGYFFARKFDRRVDPQVFDRLDEYVLAPRPANEMAA